MDEWLPQETDPYRPVFAGFWRRFNAYGIDATLVVIAAWMIEYALFGSAMAQTPDDMQLLNQAVSAMQTGQVDPALMDQAKASLLNSMLGGSVLPGPNQWMIMAVSALYNILFVIGEWQATPGKRWLRMMVVNADGSRLSLKESAMRHLTSGIAMLPLGLGNLTIFYTREKLAPHDMICGTRVVMGKTLRGLDGHA